MSEQNPNGYRVLARKYRPDRFSELIGQEALVRTLGNALTLGRLAHAFVLTGVRGVGKTSTARLLARGLNCIGEDGNGEATLEPCGTCEPCQAIGAGRHVDVLEIDAASHTGVDDAREIIEGVGYRPVSARFKIYIIDEVHMMSKSAFNALLKTLEEPPDNVKFIFATTEIRKVPVTILSRCQRFDLRRVPADELAGHLTRICERENINAEAEAVTAIARAAEGSVRDALSLLDQAAAMTADKLSPDSIADMLGRPGRQDSITILGAALEGLLVAVVPEDAVVQHDFDVVLVVPCQCQLDAELGVRHLYQVMRREVVVSLKCCVHAAEQVVKAQKCVGHACCDCVHCVSSFDGMEGLFRAPIEKHPEGCSLVRRLKPPDRNCCSWTDFHARATAAGLTLHAARLLIHPATG